MQKEKNQRLWVLFGSQLLWHHRFPCPADGYSSSIHIYGMAAPPVLAEMTAALITSAESFPTPGLLWLQFGVIKTINRSQRGSLLLPPHLGCCMSSPSCPGCWHLTGVQAAAAHRAAGIAHTAGVGFSTVLTSNPSSVLVDHLIIKI